MFIFAARPNYLETNQTNYRVDSFIDHFSLDRSLYKPSRSRTLPVPSSAYPDTKDYSATGGFACDDSAADNGLAGNLSVCSLAANFNIGTREDCKPSGDVSSQVTDGGGLEFYGAKMSLAILDNAGEGSEKTFRMPTTRAEYKSFFLHFGVPRPFYKSFSFV